MNLMNGLFYIMLHCDCFKHCRLLTRIASVGSMVWLLIQVTTESLSQATASCRVKLFGLLKARESSFGYKWGSETEVNWFAPETKKLLKSILDPYPLIVISTKWGSFSNGLPLTEFDREMDAASINPGQKHGHVSYLGVGGDSLFPEWKIWSQFLLEFFEGLRSDGLAESHK